MNRAACKWLEIYGPKLTSFKIREKQRRWSTWEYMSTFHIMISSHYTSLEMKQKFVFVIYNTQN